MASKKTSAAEKLNELRLDRNLGAAASLAEGLRPSRDLTNALVPSGVRTMLDMQRGIEKLVSPLDRLGLNVQPDAFKSLLRADRFGFNLERDAFKSLYADRFGLGRFAHADLLRATALHSQFGDMTRLLEVGKIAAAQQSITGLVATQSAAWRDVSRVTESFGVCASAVDQLRRFAAIDRSLGRVMPPLASRAWSEHLKATALGRLGFLGQKWDMPVGLLTEVAPNLGGVVCWLNQHRQQPLVMTAALAAEADDKASCEVVIEDEFVCAICDGQMQAFGDDLRWVGPRRGVRRRRIFPVCAKCWEKQREDDSFLYDALCDLTRPAVQVIWAVLSGGGQGDGRPKGVLRLVRAVARDDDA